MALPASMAYFLVLRHADEHLVDDPGGVRPISLLMREVGSPNQVLHPDVVPQAHPHRVPQKAPDRVVADVLAGWMRERIQPERSLAPKAGARVVVIRLE
jgi:hypothetical protein